MLKKQPLVDEIRLSGGVLVASFRCANPPVMWRYDVQKNHSFSVALRGQDGDWVLGLKTTDGFEDICHYTAREDAVAALELVDGALNKKGQGWRRKLGVFSVVVLGLMLVGYLTFSAFVTSLWGVFGHQEGEGQPVVAQEGVMAPSALGMPAQRPKLEANEESLGAAALGVPMKVGRPEAVPSGVPVAADQVLKAPE